jgi:hypothetical protein
VNNVIEDIHKILSDYTTAWKGSTSCPFEYTNNGTTLYVKDGNKEYVVLVTLAEGAK